MCNYQLMVETQEIRDAFAARLNSALDKNPGVRPARGRNVDLFEGIKNHPSAKASKQATHKWLNGESMPSRANMLAIADWLKVRVEWLAHGEGEMRSGTTPPPTEATPAPAASINMAALLKLKGKATPRSLDVLKRIEKAALDGRLKEADLLVLEGIAARFEELNTKQP